VIEALTHNNELNLQEPWVPEYKKAMLGAIVGVEIAMFVGVNEGLYSHGRTDS